MAPASKRSDDFSHRPFNKLGQLIDRRMLREHRPPEDAVNPVHDEALFRREMEGVREIVEFRRLEAPRPPAHRPRKRPHTDHEARRALSEIIEGRQPIRLEDTSEYAEWTNPSRPLSSAITKQLHAGLFSVKDCLDLHGHTVIEADAAVGMFIRDGLRRGYRCLKIIHGRGLKSPRGPVLKEFVIRLLSGPLSKHVDAFATARQCDGGLGALYVLLRTGTRTATKKP